MATWTNVQCGILHRTQIGQDVYIWNTHIPYKHIYRQFSVFTTSVGLAALAPIIAKAKLIK